MLRRRQKSALEIIGISGGIGWVIRPILTSARYDMMPPACMMESAGCIISSAGLDSLRRMANEKWRISNQDESHES